jgi:hypothetical protein
MHSTVVEMAAVNRRLAVTDCMFCMSSTSSPGAVRYVNDVETQLGLLSGEARLIEACGERMHAWKHKQQCNPLGSMSSSAKPHGNVSLADIS